MVWSPGKTHSPVVLGDRNSDRNHKWIRSILQDMDATGVMWTKPKDCRDYLSCGFMEANGSKWIQMDPNGTPLQHGFPANHHCHHWDELLPLNFIELPYYHWITIIGMPITHGHYASLRKKEKNGVHLLNLFHHLASLEHIWGMKHIPIPSHSTAWLLNIPTIA